MISFITIILTKSSQNLPSHHPPIPFPSRSIIFRNSIIRYNYTFHHNPTELLVTIVVVGIITIINNITIVILILIVIIVVVIIFIIIFFIIIMNLYSIYISIHCQTISSSPGVQVAMAKAFSSSKLPAAARPRILMRQ